ncbi:MAG: site-specific integrase [Clostridiales bacterium]|nr:site-specific integrase [Clostridiales bacterium]
MPRASLKKRKDNRFTAKYKGKFFYGATQSEAYANRDAYKRQEDAGLRPDMDAVLLSEYSAQWVHTYKSNVSPRSYNDHVRILNSLVAIIGDKLLRDIYPIDIQKAYNKQSGKSKSHIKKYTQTISALFSSAVNNRILLHNPCLTATPPKGFEGSHRAIDPWERDLILQSDHRFQPAVMAMLYAGLRRGEALALDVDRDVDFQKKTITVRHAIRYDANTPITANPKSEAGSRTIPLVDALASVLRPLHGLLAPSASGAKMSETAFTRAWESYIAHLEQLHNGDTTRWYGRRKGQGEDWLKANPWQPVNLRTHDLRHSYCTMLYDAGVDVKTAQKWMGHKDISTTMRIYTHLSNTRENKSVNDLQNYLKTHPSITFGSQNGSQLQSTTSKIEAL